MGVTPPHRSLFPQTGEGDFRNPSSPSMGED